MWRRGGRSKWFELAGLGVSKSTGSGPGIPVMFSSWSFFLLSTPLRMSGNKRFHAVSKKHVKVQAHVGIQQPGNHPGG